MATGDPPEPMTESEGVTTTMRRSVGLLVAPFEDGAIVHDLCSDSAHRLDGLTYVVLQSLGELSPDVLARELAGEAGVPSERAREEVRRRVDALASLNLLGRYDELRPEPLVSGSSRTGRAHVPTGGTHDVAGRSIAFRCSDADFLRAVDDFLGTSTPGGEAADVVIDIELEPDGAVTLDAMDEWRFPRAANFFAQLPGILNEYAATSDRFVVLHAGAVRRPDGVVIVIPGEGDAGKSTLTAALVVAGCDYLGDEAIGVREDLCVVGYPKRLLLDATSRSVLGIDDDSSPHVSVEAIRSGAKPLGGPVGPASRLVFAAFRPEVATPTSTVLSARESVESLMAQAFNLSRVGDAGLAALCRLATGVPAQLLVHGDAHAAAALLMDQEHSDAAVDAVAG